MPLSPHWIVPCRMQNIWNSLIRRWIILCRNHGLARSSRWGQRCVTAAKASTSTIFSAHIDIVIVVHFVCLPHRQWEWVHFDFVITPSIRSNVTTRSAATGSSSRQQAAAPQRHNYTMHKKGFKHFVFVAETETFSLLTLTFWNILFVVEIFLSDILSNTPAALGSLSLSLGHGIGRKGLTKIIRWRQRASAPRWCTHPPTPTTITIAATRHIICKHH